VGFLPSGFNGWEVRIKAGGPCPRNRRAGVRKNGSLLASGHPGRRDGGRCGSIRYNTTWAGGEGAVLVPGTGWTGYQSQ
jgi:hypothetical protein